MVNLFETMLMEINNQQKPFSRTLMDIAFAVVKTPTIGRNKADQFKELHTLKFVKCCS